jgi:hypothetical protein
MNLNISTKYANIIKIIIPLIMMIIVFYPSDDTKSINTCHNKFEGKIAAHSAYGGVIWIKLENKEELYFSVRGNLTDSFYKNVHTGFYLKKEVNSDVILTSKDSLFRDNSKSWIIPFCKYNE